MGGPFDDDPLSAATAPPPNETQEEKAARESAEVEARRVSDAIDEEIRLERTALKKKKRPVKVLLLGQSESGKSATLKNFMLNYSPREWMKERASWRAVIQLNLIRNVNDILDVIGDEMTSSEGNSSTDTRFSKNDSGTYALTTLSTPATPVTEFSRNLVIPSSNLFTERHRLLRSRLRPFREIQKDLERGLGAAAREEIDIHSGPNAAPSGTYDEWRQGNRTPQEFYVQSHDGWRSVLRKVLSSTLGGSSAEFNSRRKNEEIDDIRTAEILVQFKDDMKAIWEDSVLRDILSKHKMRLEEAPGFYMNDISRIASNDYEPTDNDVVRARLRTLGVQEHEFVFEKGSTSGQVWMMYDVGGTRSSRAAWYPYFDDMDAVIFLAPISCFDEMLAEDPSVNRLEDSFLLWKSCDLLKTKLQRGVRIKDSVTSYGERDNNVETATRYFQHHFKEIFKQSSPKPRPFYCHLTSVIDTKATAVTLNVVEEGILRNHLHRAGLL